MPNWCYSDYRFYGDNDAVERFYRKLKDMAENPENHPNFIKNSFDGLFLGNVIVGFGLDYEKCKKDGILLRGQIFTSDIIIEKHNEMLVVSFPVESAWGPMPEMWDMIIKKCFTDEEDDQKLFYVYMAEEPSNGVYVNTDVEGIFFPERYGIDIYGIEGYPDDSYYFSTEEEFLKKANEIFKVEFSSYENASRFIDRFSAEHEEGVAMCFVYEEC